MEGDIIAIEDWKPAWTKEDIKCVWYPLLVLFNTLYWMYVIRYCIDIINTVPWQHSILLKPLVAAALVGEGIFFLILITMDGIKEVHYEVTK
jgi:hypothetical protein